MKRAFLVMMCFGVALAAMALAFAQEETMPGPAPPEPEATPEEVVPAIHGVGKIRKIVPDAVLYKQIRDGLLEAKRPEFPSIQTEVKHGIVTMTGRVRTFQDRALAEAIARANPGVRDVHSAIKVRSGFRPPLQPGDKRTLPTVADDEKVRDAVLKRIPRCPGARPSQLKVEVYNRVAVVGGWVLSEAAADCLRHTVKFTPNVSTAVVCVIVEPLPEETPSAPPEAGPDSSPTP
jgi:osmotically-inducible protein OsmY